MSWFKKKKDNFETKKNEHKEHWWSSWKKHPNKKQQEEIKEENPIEQISVDDYHIVDKHSNDSYILSDEEELNLKEQKTKLLNMMIENTSDNNTDVLSSCKHTNPFNKEANKRFVKADNKTEPVEIIDIKEPFIVFDDDIQEDIKQENIIDRIDNQIKKDVNQNPNKINQNQKNIESQLDEERSLDELLNQSDLFQDQIEEVKKQPIKENITIKQNLKTKSIDNSNIDETKQNLIKQQNRIKNEELIKNQEKLLIQKQKELKRKELEILEQANQQHIDLSIFDDDKNLKYLEPVPSVKRQFRIYKAERRRFKPISN